MKERERFDIQETFHRVYARDHGRCRYPGCTSPGVWLAHCIAQTKANIRKYGKYVIHHDDNLRLICTDPAHNDYFNIGGRPVQAQQLADEILGSITCHPCGHF